MGGWGGFGGDKGSGIIGGWCKWGKHVQATRRILKNSNLCIFAIWIKLAALIETTIAMARIVKGIKKPTMERITTSIIFVVGWSNNNQWSIGEYGFMSLAWWTSIVDTGRRMCLGLVLWWWTW
jgi:hypothetical protein